MLTWRLICSFYHLFFLDFGVDNGVGFKKGRFPYRGSLSADLSIVLSLSNHSLLPLPSLDPTTTPKSLVIVPKRLTSHKHPAKNLSYPLP